MRRAALTITVVIALTLTLLALAAPRLVAQEHAEGETVVAAADAGGGLTVGMKAIGAAAAIGLSALGTGLAQSRIGAAGAGAVAEKPESAGTVIILLAIPETLVILGFVIAAMIMLIL